MIEAFNTGAVGRGTRYNRAFMAFANIIDYQRALSWLEINNERITNGVQAASGGAQ